MGPGSRRRRAIDPAGRPFGAFRTSKRKILSRLSCARAASESTADDVFIFPKQWKYRIITRASQWISQDRRYLHEFWRRMSDEFPGRKESFWACARLALGFLQMFRAVFSVTLLIRTGVTTLALTAVTMTSVLTALSVLLFGARRSKRWRS